MTFKIFIISILAIIYLPAFAIEADSISTLKKNGQTVILYEVGSKETMYSIARKYNISPKSIVAINPEIENAALKVGQKIFVPYETARIPKNNATPTLAEVPGATYHVVERKQTLYTVARMYKATVDDLRRWNNLIDSDLKVGSKIIVNMNAEVVKQTAIEVNIEATRKTIRSNTGYDKITEKGKAEVFDTKDGENYYYVLHRTLATGTVLKITNDATAASVYGRVIGKLPDNYDKNTIIKLSRLAYSTLGGLSANMNVKIEYLP
ncbi:MAG: LysM peptidoglycan-binding domain-containing protein [Cytophagales bacterium]